MAARLTEEQKQTYIQGGAIVCPFCGSEDIGGRAVEVEAGTATQGVSCHACRKYWTDIYKIVDVSHMDDDLDCTCND